MISYKERQYLCWFLSVPGIGAVTGMRLFKQFKSFEEIYNIEANWTDEKENWKNWKRRESV